MTLKNGFGKCLLQQQQQQQQSLFRAQKSLQ